MQNEEPKKPVSADFYTKFGIIVILTVFGGLIFWSVVAPIQGAVTAPGQVVVEGNRKVVQHLDGGTVADILVSEGAKVEQGDIIVRLDDTVAKANLDLVDGQLAELYARRARLEAERDDEEMTQARGQQQILGRANFQEKYEGQKALFFARATTAKTQISLLKETITQLNERISGLRIRIRSLDNQIVIINEELEGVRDLFSQGFAPRTRLNELERQGEALNGERGSLRASIAESESGISEARLEIERLTETRREEAITELREAESSIGELEERRIGAADGLERTRIRAPNGGRVLNLSTHTVGGVIGPGTPLMEIVPEGMNLLVSARISPQDVDKVQAGQLTLVRFSGFGSRRTPETDGEVSTISADAIIDETTGAPYYLVMIDLPVGDELAQILRGNVLVPGMPVETFIQTEKRPAISYLLKPLMDSFARSMRED